MNLTPDEIARITHSIVEALDERHGMTSEQHAEDHLLMRAIALERKEKADMYRAIRENVFGWGIIGVIGGLVWLAWFFMTHAFVTVAEKAT